MHTAPTETPRKSFSPVEETAREPVQQLRRLVAQNGTRWRRLVLLEALGLALSAPLAYLLLLFLIDTEFHLPVWGRALASLGFVIGVAGLAVRLVRRWRSLRLTEDQIALAIERRTPGGVQNRLINAVQIARDGRGADPEYSQAVVEENYQCLQQIELERAVQTRPAAVWMGTAAALLVVGLGFWLWKPEQFSNAAARILLPFADVEPIYRTVLVVEPGDVEAAGDVTIRVRIRGERPETITVLSNTQGKRSAEVLPVEADAAEITYTFRDVQQSMTYAARGGDFTSRTYRIEVPTPALLSLVRATFRLPAYTGLPEKAVEKAGGDLEALLGTIAQVTFVLDQPAEGAALWVEHVPPSKRPDAEVIAEGLMPATVLARLAAPPRPIVRELLMERVELARLSPTEFSGELTFEDVAAYQIETRQAGKQPHRSTPYALRMLADQEPKLELSGLDRQADVQIESILPLQIRATDDYGLQKVGLFVRRTTATARPGEDVEGWQPVVVWPIARQTAFQRSHDLPVSALKAGEGEKLELALRGVDTDPLKGGRWTTGPVHSLLVGGEGVALQLQYEQIVRSEAELTALVRAQREVLAQVAEWVRKLDGAGGLRWDEPKNLNALHAAVQEQGKAQEKVRDMASRVARAMVAQAGNLRISVGMLADTEMIRAIRILDSVATRDQPQAKRSALAEARTTEERTVRSLQEVLEQYQTFRSDWELAHMIPFVKMLAERQAKLAAQSQKNAEPTAGKLAEPQRASAHRRQTKMVELCQLIRPACAGLGERLQNSEPTIGTAFTAAATALGSETVKGPMRQAAEDVQAGRWSEAAPKQTAAARELEALAARLRQAQLDAAQLALRALQQKALSDVAAQKAIEKLQAGTTASGLKDIPGKLNIEEIIHMQQTVQKKNDGDYNEIIKNQVYSDAAKKMMENMGPGKPQDFDILKLASTPEKGTIRFPKVNTGETNTVKPFVHEKFDDLVGKLLEEADDLNKKWDTLGMNYSGMHGDPGEIGKQGGALNSTSADSATGNMKPNINHSAGVSRPGRQGARAGGMIVGDESINRRGRDNPMEGHQRAPDQPGLLREKNSDDMQKTTSTGYGGKRVKSDETTFSLSDAGKWRDEIVKRMGDPQKKHSIVERQDGRIDPRVAEQLRDLTSKQEQVIERIKTIQKELRNLYLPTDHLSEIEKEMYANLESLKSRPDADLFRLQAQLLDRLRDRLKVFRSANAGFQPSLPREQVIRGRVLDEPARPTLPGYEEAVKRYYERLAAQ